MVATNVDPTKTATVKRKNKDGTTRMVPCPQSPLLYNKYMGGVNINDQLRSYYHLRLKGRKYYKYIFWFLVNVTITNTYILCKHHTQLNITSTKDFRVELAKSLIGSYYSRKRPGRPSVLLQYQSDLSLQTTSHVRDAVVQIFNVHIHVNVPAPVERTIRRRIAQSDFSLSSDIQVCTCLYMFSSVKDSRLMFFRSESFQSRIATRRELEETNEAKGGHRVGRVYLPASFMGSPRKPSWHEWPGSK